MRIGSLLAAWGRPRTAGGWAVVDTKNPHAVKVHYLSTMDVFRDLARSDVERLAETTRMITCPRGRVIYRAGGRPARRQRRSRTERWSRG